MSPDYQRDSFHICMYVCIYVCMRLCIYLFISIQRTFSKEDKRAGPFALGWMCQGMPGSFKGLEPPADFVCREAAWTLCPSGKLPVENSSPRLTQLCGCGLRPFASLLCIPLLPPTRRAAEESHSLGSRCPKTWGLGK